MISIVVGSYGRGKYLKHTIESLKYIDKDTFELIVVNEYDEDLNFLLSSGVNCKIIKTSERFWCNPCVAYNIGFNSASGDKIFIQNAECYHIKKPLLHLDDVYDDVYKVFGCYSLDRKQTEDIMNGDTSNIVINNRSVSCEGDSAWYHHSVHRNCRLHFASVLTKSRLLDIGGFDLRMAFGWGYDDNFLLYSLEKKCKVICDDENYVYHLNHYSIPGQSHLRRIDNGLLYCYLQINRIDTLEPVRDDLKKLRTILKERYGLKDELLKSLQEY